MTIGNPYKVTKKIKIHTSPLTEIEVAKTGVFKSETSKMYIFEGFRVRKESVIKIDEVREWNAETIKEFAKRLEKHYPHTNSILNTIEKEMNKMLGEIKK